jgi:ferredoxin
VFDFTGDGLVAVLPEHRDSVARSERPDVLAAANACPRQAINIIPDDELSGRRLRSDRVRR